MGKYMRKAKITGEVAVMDVSHQPSLGVRTRARTLALQRLQVTPAPPDNPDDPSCYLQLRSCRLGKTQTLASRRAAATRSKEGSKGGASPDSDGWGTGASKDGGFRPHHGKDSENSGSAGEVEVRKSCSKLEEVADDVQEAVAKAFALAAADDEGVEASFGDNALDLVSGGSRNSRETTPCSLIRDSGNIPTPGSTSRPPKGKLQNAACRNIPTKLEMEEFFTDAEQVLQQEQRAFMEKYNFDPVNDCPLPGRYEWVRVVDSL